MYRIHICNGKGAIASISVNSVSAIEVDDMHLYNGKFDIESYRICSDWLWFGGQPMGSWPMCRLGTENGQVFGDLPVTTRWSGDMYVECPQELVVAIDILPLYPILKL